MGKEEVNAANLGRNSEHKSHQDIVLTNGALY